MIQKYFESEMNVLILAVDEVQVYHQYLKNNWKTAIREILKYMCNTEGKNERLLRDKLCIIPIVAGTLPPNIKIFR